MEEERKGQGRVAFGCHLIWMWMSGFLMERQAEICLEQA